MHGYIYDSVCSDCSPHSINECKHCWVMKNEHETRKKKETNDAPDSVETENR